MYMYIFISCFICDQIFILCLICHQVIVKLVFLGGDLPGLCSICGVSQFNGLNGCSRCKKKFPRIKIGKLYFICSWYYLQLYMHMCHKHNYKLKVTRRMLNIWLITWRLYIIFKMILVVILMFWCFAIIRRFRICYWLLGKSRCRAPLSRRSENSCNAVEKCGIWCRS